MAKQKSLMRGMLAGMAGGLVAAWMMNEFIVKPNQQLEQPLAEEETGPLAHYAFGVLSGGIYGGLAEYSGIVRSGFGTSYGGVLFSTAAPVLGIPSLEMDQPSSSPIAAHVVYGVTTELVRRVVRAVI
jgi:putative membrane protein